VPVRAARRNATGSGPSRRTANAIAAADSRSSHWRSSTSTRTGRCSAQAASNDIVAAATRNGSADAGADDQPSAVRSAAACVSGTSETRSRIGLTSSSSPACDKCDSDSTPRAVRHLKPSADARAASSSVVLPTPGSPSINSAVDRPAAASASRAAMSASSVSRPTTAGEVLGVLPDATSVAPAPPSTGNPPPEGVTDADIRTDRRETGALAGLARMGVLHRLVLPTNRTASSAASVSRRSRSRRDGIAPVRRPGSWLGAGRDHLRRRLACRPHCDRPGRQSALSTQMCSISSL
jgi:hypothetical protein